MPDYVKYIDVRPKVSLKVSDHQHTLDSTILNRVDAIWNAALKSPACHLFNGTIYSVYETVPSGFLTRPTEYKYYYAQLIDPTLTSYLNISPLACTGILTCNDGLVLGKRSENVTLDAGKWELAPAGTFDEDCLSNGLLDASKLIKKEIHEELGIPETLVETMGAIAAFEDPVAYTVDILMRVHVPIFKAQLFEYFNKRAQAEYTNVDVVPLHSLEAFASQKQDHLNWVSLAALSRLDMLTACSPSG